VPRRIGRGHRPYIADIAERIGPLSRPMKSRL
jgi:hypothetical protein